MRISELSRRSGVPVATIKYYIRENLLPKGAATSSTQARYSDKHLRRLRLIRALLETAEMPLARIHTVLDAMDDPEVDLHHLLGTTQYALAPDAGTPEGDAEWEKANARTTRLLADLGWSVTGFSPARRQLTAAMATMARLGQPAAPAILRTYATAAHRVAECDVDAIDPDAPREEAVDRAVVMGALMERVLAALHHLAREHESARRFGGTDGAG